MACSNLSVFLIKYQNRPSLKGHLLGYASRATVQGLNPIRFFKASKKIELLVIQLI